MARMRNDGLTYQGAHEIAAMVRAYWHQRGYVNVTTWAEEFKLPAACRASPDTRGALFCVRSNLVGGLPPPVVMNEEAVQPQCT